MATALSTLRTDTYAILNELQTSDLYSTTYIDLLLNTKQTELCARSKWTFLRTKSLFYAPAYTSLDANITTASTVLSVDSTTNAETAGAVRVQHDVINYTGKTSTTYTGCTNIDLSHSSGAEVEPLITLPSDYFRMPELYVQRSTNGRFEPWIYVDELEYNWSPVYHKFTIINDKNGNRYLLIAHVSTTDVIAFHYLKTPTAMSSDSSTATIPDPYAEKILPLMAASEAMIQRGDDMNGLGTTLLGQAERHIIQMLKYYGEREQNMRYVVESGYQSRRPRLYTRN